MTRYVGIPSVPLDADPTIVRILSALKENVELLTNQRGESDRASAALNSGSLTVNPVSGTFQSLSARGLGASISGVAVPLQDDYAKALRDIQKLASDLDALRTVVNQLISELRS